MAIGVTPTKLEFLVKSREATTHQIFLQNLEERPVAVRLMIADRELTDRFQITPDNPMLSPGRVLPIEITVITSQALATELAIVPQAQERPDLQVFAGIKIPIKVTVENDFSLIPWLAAFIFLLAGFGLYFLIRKKTATQ